MKRKFITLITKLIGIGIVVLLTKIYLFSNLFKSSEWEVVLFLGLSSVFVLFLSYLLMTSKKKGDK